jgi:enoyl-CoA hydratase
MRMETGTELLLLDIEGPVATVTFNDPARHNVLSREMQRALVPVAHALERDDDVRVVVVRGAGDRAFAAGADIGEFDEPRTDERAGPDDAAPTAWNCLQRLSKPVVGQIGGYCIGGGLLMALQADVRICSEDSSFAVPAARLGLGYGLAGVRALMQVAGPSVAADILFSARRLTSAEAYVAGLVNRVVPKDQLDAAVRSTVEQIAANAPLTIRACKAAIRHELDGAGLAEVERLVQQCWDSEDFMEGRAAFRDKREPAFRGV